MPYPKWKSLVPHITDLSQEDCVVIKTFFYETLSLKLGNRNNLQYQDQWTSTSNEADSKALWYGGLS